MASEADIFESLAGGSEYPPRLVGVERAGAVERDPDACHWRITGRPGNLAQ
jgi:hypothetical protein